MVDAVLSMGVNVLLCDIDAVWLLAAPHHFLDCPLTAVAHFLQCSFALR